MFALLGVGYFAVTTIPLAIIDFKEHRLPNRITLPGIAVTLLGLVLVFDWTRLGIALLVAVAAFGVGLGLSLKGWIGMGDVKLVASLSLILAWFQPLLLVNFFAYSFAIAGLVVSVLMLRKKITARSAIALGPYLLIGFWLAVAPQVSGQLGGGF